MTGKKLTLLAAVSTSLCVGVLLLFLNEREQAFASKCLSQSISEHANALGQTKEILEKLLQKKTYNRVKQLILATENLDKTKIQFHQIGSRKRIATHCLYFVFSDLDLLEGIRINSSCGKCK